jgi:Domain of unknown function (DUF4864)
MRALLAAFVIMAGLVSAGRAEEPGNLAATDRDAIQSVISRQMQAFRRDDAAGAFGFAAPTIQSMFGDADHFMTVVRQDYQPVYRPRSVAFGQVIEAHGKAIQKVEVVGPDGRPRLALYTMERQADGSWRIAGCVLTESEAVGA